MSEALSLSPAEVDDQHIELLPARTVLSLFSSATDGTGNTSGAGDTGGAASVSHNMGAGDPYYWVYTGDGGAGGPVNGGSGRP